MSGNGTNRADAALTGTVQVLIVEEQVPPSQRSRLTDSVSSVLLDQATVTTVARAADAPAVLGRGAQTAGEHWFVICGLTPRSWSTLVLLEWIRGHAAAPLIHAALLTEMAYELLPIAVVDHPGVRVMSPSPSLTELQTWFRSSRASPPRLVSR